MPKNREKADRTAIREHYARKYAGKLKEKDGVIAGLRERNKSLEEQVKSLEERLALEKGSVAQLDSLTRTMQSWLELSDEELLKVKADIGARAKAAESMAEFRKLLAAMGGPIYGALAPMADIFGGIM